MGLRVGGAILLAAMLAGCAGNQPLSGLPGLSSYAMTTPEPAQPASAQADAAFRMRELKPGLSMAELQAMYPGRLAFGGGGGRDALYFVEAMGVTPRSTDVRDRLSLWLTDGKLDTFAIVRTAEVAAGAAPALPTAKSAATPPSGKFGVQVAARRTEAEARALVDEMRAKYPSLLGQQWATLYRVSLPNGVFYRVVLGPIASAQEAAQLCGSLKAQGTDCIIRGS